MRELNSLIYNTIRVDGIYQDLCGATLQDPRIYKAKTPVNLKITDTKVAYSVYYMAGSSRPYPFIHPIEKNNYTYVLEIYGKKDTVVSEIGYRIENLFAHKRFTTTSFIVNYTYVNRGSCNWDDVRQLYTETLTINLTHIIALDEAS